MTCPPTEGKAPHLKIGCVLYRDSVCLYRNAHIEIHQYQKLVRLSITGHAPIHAVIIWAPWKKQGPIHKEDYKHRYQSLTGGPKFTTPADWDRIGRNVRILGTIRAHSLSGTPFFPNYTSIVATWVFNPRAQSKENLPLIYPSDQSLVL